MNFQDVIEDNLFNQTLDLLLTKYLTSTISYQKAQRIETLPISELALREALVNAVIHKDYSSQYPIQIGVYDDKLLIWNSGELPQH